MVKRPIQKLTRIWDDLLLGPLAQDFTFDRLRQARVATALVIVCPPLLVAWGLRHLFAGDLPLGIFNLFFACTVVMSFVLRRFIFNTHRETWIYRINVLFLWIECFFFITRSGKDSSELLWLYIYPLVVFYLMGSKEGLFWVSSVLAATVVFFLAPQLYGFDHDFTPYFMQSFLFSYLLVITISAATEIARRQFQRATESHQNALQIETAKLEEASRIAEEANQAKSHFIAGLSHEFRTPLTHIMGFTDLTLREEYGDLNDVQREYLKDVLESSRHLHSLINNILDVSAIERGTLDLQLDDVDVAQLVNDGVAIVAVEVEEKGIKITSSAADAVSTIRGDITRLKQIVYNLLANAVKYTHPGGAIDISCRMIGAASNTAEDALEIAISDTGIGLEKRDVNRIFEAFVRVGDRAEEGTGLGLSLAKRLVELHGGKISAESDGPGKGSTFRFTVPISGGPS